MDIVGFLRAAAPEQAAEVIGLLNSAVYRDVLTLRYVKKLSWTAVGMRMNYSSRQAQRKARQAINVLSWVISDDMMEVQDADNREEDRGDQALREKSEE